MLFLDTVTLIIISMAALSIILSSPSVHAQAVYL